MFWYQTTENHIYRQIGQSLCFKAGTELDMTRHVALLEKGMCALYTLTQEGNERIFLYFKAGNLMGFLKHVLIQNKYPGAHIYKARHRIYARTNVEVTLILKNDFFDLVQRNPACNMDYTMGLSQNLSNMLEHSALVACESAPVRICAMLLELSEDKGRTRILPSFITQAEIANFLSLHKVTVAKVLKRLRDEGGIRRQGRRMEIVDPTLLTGVVEKQQSILY